MTGNAHGSYITTQQLMMEAYDKLPKEVRDVFKYMPDNYVPQPILTEYKRKCKNNFRSDAVKHCVNRANDWCKQGIKEHWYRMYRFFDSGTDFFKPIRMNRSTRKG